MADNLARRRKRLLFRSIRRGMRESDLILGGFAKQHVDGMGAEQLGRFETLLERNDPELMAWITGTQPVPAEFDHDVMNLLQNFKNTLSNL